MNLIKRVLLVLLAVTPCFMFTACNSGATTESGTTQEVSQSTSKSQDLTEYTSPGNTFTVKLPGEWTIAETDNEDHLVLDNSDQSLSVLIQRFPKDSLGLNALDDFINLYKTSALASLQTYITNEPTDLSIDTMVAAKTEDYEMSQDDTTFKSHIIYVESEKSYYSFTITGIANLYDENIEALSNSVHTLVEN